jgi:hypothetical protein
MANSTLIRTKLLPALTVAFGFAATGYAPAQVARSTPVIQFAGYGSTVFNFNTDNNKFSAFGQTLNDSSIAGQFKSVKATLQAMERAGVIRTSA